MFGALGSASQQTSVTFLSAAAVASGVAEELDLKSKTSSVENCRSIQKSDMIHNEWQPDISVDPETYKVVADGEHLHCEPADVLPLAQLYQLF